MHETMKKPIVVFISGKGTNLKAIVERCMIAQVVAVISDRRDAEGLIYARSQGINTHVITPTIAIDVYNHLIIGLVSEYKPKLIALAGYMQLLPKEVVLSFAGEIINVHPSLLPKYKGLRTYERVIDNKETETGLTIHYVDVGLDTGPTIFQLGFDILPGTTAEELKTQTKSMEHIWYPFVIDKLLQ